jgi:hypothetical protein
MKSGFMPTYSIYEVYQHLKTISNGEQLSILMEIISDEKGQYKQADYHSLKGLIESKKQYLEQLDRMEYRLISQVKKKN